MSQRIDKPGVILPSHQIAQERWRPTGRDGENPEAEIDHVDWTAVLKVPAAANCGGNGHLA